MDTFSLLLLYDVEQCSLKLLSIQNISPFLIGLQSSANSG